MFCFFLLLIFSSFSNISTCDARSQRPTIEQTCVIFKTKKNVFFVWCYCLTMRPQPAAQYLFSYWSEAKICIISNTKNNKIARKKDQWNSVADFFFFSLHSHFHSSIDSISNMAGCRPFGKMCNRMHYGVRSVDQIKSIMLLYNMFVRWAKP